MEPTETYHKNNLEKSFSPYLRQHAKNPVWWQEFNEDTLKYAAEKSKPLLLSSGYSTCHWCHVMASDAFSDASTAAFLNKHFVCVKIDRETHPDIDDWMMAYLQKETGQGGWPLNVFATPDLKPFYALMFAPAKEGGYGRPSFLNILKEVLIAYNQKKASFSSFNISVPISGEAKTDDFGFKDESQICSAMYQYFDTEEGGLYGMQKFPPHATLFYLLHLQNFNEYTDTFLRYTLQTMSRSGLHDHLQGGFYRYCTDRRWRVPHFEKMLYDQAMMLMNYALATHRFKLLEFKDVVAAIIKCLEETFEAGDLLAAAHDADTNHQEGLTYLWTEDEIKQLLTPDEAKIFHQRYLCHSFEGRCHLIKKKDAPLDEIEAKLLKQRAERPQPFRDDKCITSWNALAAIAFIYAHRYAGFDTFGKAKMVFEKLLLKHKRPHGMIAHASLGGAVQDKTYLEDMAAMLLLGTYLFEEDAVEKATLETLLKGVLSFKRNGNWYASTDSLIGPVPASTHDHPYPSAVSMAEAAIVRYKLLTNSVVEPLSFKSPLSCDFYNMAVKWSRNQYAVYGTPTVINAGLIRPGSLQKRSSKPTICINNTCKDLNVEAYQKLIS